MGFPEFTRGALNHCQSIHAMIKQEIAHLNVANLMFLLNSVEYTSLHNSSIRVPFALRKKLLYPLEDSATSVLNPIRMLPRAKSSF